MDHLQDQDLLKLKELLRHAGEFIAYFEVAETKMIAWRQEIEHQSQAQYESINQVLSQVHEELTHLEDVLTQAGLARLRLNTEQILQQGETQLHTAYKTSQQLLNDISAQHREFNKMVAKSIQLIEHHTAQSITHIDSQLKSYDAQHFKRVANESCEYVEQVANKTIHHCNTFLKAFHWRSIALALMASLLTALSIGLYANNEWPWEIHQNAMSEREAGRTLIKAWPVLSAEERNKILHNYTTPKT